MSGKHIPFAMPLLGAFLIGLGAYADNAQPPRPAGMPTNELVAFADFKGTPVVDSATLAEALELRYWNFQVQVPDGTQRLRVDLHLVDKDADRVLGKLNLDATEWDGTAGKHIPGSKQFRVFIMISPVDMSPEDPLRQSGKLRVFAKGSPKDSSHASILIENPFKNDDGGIITDTSPELVRDRKVPSGSWDGFGTRFNLMESNGRQRILRISFEKD